MGACWKWLAVRSHQMGIVSPVTEVHQKRRASQPEEPGTGGHVPATDGLRLEDSRTSAYCLAVMAQEDAAGRMKPPALPCLASAGTLLVPMPSADLHSASRRVGVHTVVAVIAAASKEAVPAAAPIPQAAGVAAADWLGKLAITAAVAVAGEVPPAVAAAADAAARQAGPAMPAALIAAVLPAAVIAAVPLAAVLLKIAARLRPPS